LRVEHNRFYNVPSITYDRFEDFDPTLFPLAIHHVPFGDLVIPAMARHTDGDFLAVTFNGAFNRARGELPFFNRVTTWLERTEPFLLFSDPVLALDPNLQLGWYAGTMTTDPTSAMAEMIRIVQGSTDTNRVCFQGASGGGFAALQMSARFPGSLAFVCAPQTAVCRASPHWLQPYLDVAFPGMSSLDVESSFPERFSCLELYRGKPIENFIYYAQNTGDERHVTYHFRPFLDALDCEPVDGIYRDGHLQVKLVDLGVGHILPPPHLWRACFAEALSLLDHECSSAMSGVNQAQTALRV
jgi:hypothetical protein